MRCNRPKQFFFGGGGGWPPYNDHGVVAQYPVTFAALRYQHTMDGIESGAAWCHSIGDMQQHPRECYTDDYMTSMLFSK